MARGCFITLEGIEGSGKTTQAAILANSLRTRGYDVMLTREPGGTRTGELIRAIFLDSTLSLTSNAELLLVLADRAQHVEEKLRPALQSGRVVISDRFSDSTIAYQGYGRGLDLKLVEELNRLSSSGVIPDLTLLLDCPAEKGLARTRLRADTAARTPDRFEQEDLEFHRRVRNGFLSIAGSERSRVMLLDASRNQDEVSTDILRIVLERVERR